MRPHTNTDHRHFGNSVPHDALSAERNGNICQDGLGARGKSPRLTVKVKSVLPSPPTFCKITSTSIFASPTGPRSGTPPLCTGHPENSQLGFIAIEGNSSNRRRFHVVLLIHGNERSGPINNHQHTQRHRVLASKLHRANCSTLEPILAICISSKVIFSRRRAPSTIRGSVV